MDSFGPVVDGILRIVMADTLSVNFGVNQAGSGGDQRATKGSRFAKSRW
jgi:hypothetical protein